eukprot:scaffold76841_cov69-Phaeocystis_antarctica.AAC.5
MRPSVSHAASHAPGPCSRNCAAQHADSTTRRCTAGWCRRSSRRFGMQPIRRASPSSLAISCDLALEVGGEIAFSRQQLCPVARAELGERWHRTEGRAGVANEGERGAKVRAEYMLEAAARVGLTLSKHGHMRLEKGEAGRVAGAQHHDVAAGKARAVIKKDGAVIEHLADVRVAQRGAMLSHGFEEAQVLRTEAVIRQAAVTRVESERVALERREGAPATPQEAICELCLALASRCALTQTTSQPSMLCRAPCIASGATVR